jgi:organic radical activating enzyme
MYTEPWGRAALCCIATESVRDGEGRPLNLAIHSFGEIWNSRYYRDVRRKMYAGERVPACRMCYENEANNIQSYRQWANDYWLAQRESAPALAASVERSAGRDFEADEPASFDLRVGNLCNLKCRMCNAGYSSQIEKDPVHGRWHPAAEPTSREHRFHGSPGEDWSESPELLEELKALGGRIEMIQLAGGEPTLNRTQTEWLRYLCETGTAPRVQLTVWTNLTNVHEEYFRMLSEFRSAALNLSVDGCGSTYDYIRFPARWTEFEKNVRRAARYPRLSMAVAPVLQAYNLLDITDLYRWADEHGLRSQMNRLENPSYLRFDVLPTRARQLAKDRIDAHVAAVRSRQGHDKAFADSLEGFGRQVVESAPPSAETITRFWEFTRALDDSRGQSLERSCPELFKLMTADRVVASAR